MSMYEIFRYLENKNLIDDAISYAKNMYLMERRSIYNSMLLFVQRPHLGYTLTETQWNQRNRFLKPEARPLVALKPFGPTVLYYEYEDTYSDSYKKHNRDDKHYSMGDLNGTDLQSYDEAAVGLYEPLKRLVNSFGVYYCERDTGMRSGGSINYNENFYTVKIQGINKERIIRTHYVIEINSRLSTANKAATILHELGHLLCGHIRKAKDNKDVVSFRDRTKLDEKHKESEAESVSAMVLHICGIDYSPVEYLKDYKVNNYQEYIDYDEVIKASDKILKGLKAV